ncbi:hypothetical protein M6B22_02870 [Jatrophihabitans cynanchi]|uniref:Uncharacterized protein n=1 Tax=Jatrophihabitans cynanchi TaxID=2944128 RepID=A0ABY7K171_9ACTN|nr:hypothetical protein [Jatrophihabitans sp. SB3-54]WAX57720.1 hypothetical protein M6B22_02870 [Jatrophihabitans sp. SB3-54]
MNRPDDDLVSRIRALLRVSEADSETEPAQLPDGVSADAALAFGFADGGRADVYVFDTGAAAAAAQATVRDSDPAPARTAVNGALLVVLSGEHEQRTLRRRASHFAGRE